MLLMVAKSLQESDRHSCCHAACVCKVSSALHAGCNVAAVAAGLPQRRHCLVLTAQWLGYPRTCPLWSARSACIWLSSDRSLKCPQRALQQRPHLLQGQRVGARILQSRRETVGGRQTFPLQGKSLQHSRLCSEEHTFQRCCMQHQTVPVCSGKYCAERLYRRLVLSIGPRADDHGQKGAADAVLAAGVRWGSSSARTAPGASTRASTMASLLS